MEWIRLYNKDHCSVDGKKESNYYHLKFRGEINSKELVDSILENIVSQMELAILEGYSNRIIDFSDTLLKADSKVPKEVAQKMSSLYKKYPDSKVAIIANKHINFNELNLYHSVNNLGDKVRNVFNNEDDALAWLKD